VLRYFGSPRIPGHVQRIVPPLSDDPRIKAYYEFIDFHRNTKIYNVQFTQPGNYAKLLAALGKEPGEQWSERERLTFSSYFTYFRDAYSSVVGDQPAMKPEDALLIWLNLYPYTDLGKLSTADLKKTVQGLKDDFAVLAQADPVAVKTAPAAAAKGNIIERIISPNPDHVTVAFVHQRDINSSMWTRAHDEGRQYLEQVLGSQVTTLSYFNADSPAESEAILERAVAAGADVIFTTTPQLCRLSLKIAVKYPRVRVLNCSVNVPYPSIRTYYNRIYEGKFITGAIAGAMATNNRIGYVGSSPIFGVPASINAFALGAQLTNPRAKIELRWSCQAGDSVAAFIGEGLSVISNRDIPTQDGRHMLQGDYGTYLVEDSGSLVPLGSPIWVWGRFYENVIRSILSGAWNNEKTERAVNYWWGMDSGVIDVKLSDRLPDGVRCMADILRDGLRRGIIDPFARPITAQDGTVKNDGGRTFTPDELLHMDWLCSNVEGVIPSFDEIEPFAQPIVRELGIYRDKLPAQKEV
jgi:basic membrane lipoprotein Med (substrate-binding protein (PBP1-ABC) superfamily)